MRSGPAKTPGAARRLSTRLRALQNAVSLWLILQQTAAAVLAWLIATTLVGHDEPFFAPMAAVIALNATLGERGLNAVRMLLGVIVGISVGEITIAVLGSGYGRLALATFTAMVIARALNANRIVVAQAAASAILTVVALEGRQVGFERLTDAFVGGGIALVFTQVLFSPEPVRLLRGAQAAGLAAIAELLDRTARALEDEDAALAERTLRHLQEVRNQLGEVERTRRASSRVHRHSVAWRSRSRAVAVHQESTRAGRLDVLGGSCLVLARICLARSGAESKVLAPRIRELARTIGDFATTFDDDDARQRAADRALTLASTLWGRQPARSSLSAATMLLEIVTTDFMTFVGIDPNDVADRFTS